MGQSGFVEKAQQGELIGHTSKHLSLFLFATCQKEDRGDAAIQPTHSSLTTQNGI
jgi:hypothetical protein